MNTNPNKARSEKDNSLQNHHRFASKPSSPPPLPTAPTTKEGSRYPGKIRKRSLINVHTQAINALFQMLVWGIVHGRSEHLLKTCFSFYMSYFHDCLQNTLKKGFMEFNCRFCCGKRRRITEPLMQVKAPCVFSKKTMSVCKNRSKGFPLNKLATQEKIDRQDPIVYLSLIPIFMGRALIILIYHQGVGAV